ncbi:MAG: methyltransferase [Methanosarcinales archaeon]|nr:methyltransferase [Methanosarcinales archaeon]
MIICPTCGGTDCIRPAEDVLDSIYQMYMACPECPPEPGWDKQVPLAALLHGDTVDENTLLCISCRRRPLDGVMGHVLAVMLKHGDKEEGAGLALVGTPLIACGFPIMYPPRLGKRDLVLIADNVRPDTAEDIVDRVPEVRGVVLRVGDQAQSVGILDPDSRPHEYTLLAGCDMRCDVAQTALGELVIYKSQSRIHIEFPRESGHKMDVLGKLDMEGLLAGRVVVDGMCGPGTLGLMSVLMGASKVILNDAWRPAIENVLLNLEVNRELLDVEVERLIPSGDMPLIGDEPLLVAKAIRDSNTIAKVYFSDIRRLAGVVDDCDVCLIDTFPTADPSEYVKIWNEKVSCGKVIVI